MLSVFVSLAFEIFKNNPRFFRYNTYYYTLDVPQGKDPREYFFDVYGEYPDICMRKGTVKNG